MRLPYELGDDYSLALRDGSTVQAMHELTISELSRLRAWEPWAAADQTLASAQSYAAFTTASYEQGPVCPR